MPNHSPLHFQSASSVQGSPGWLAPIRSRPVASEPLSTKRLIEQEVKRLIDEGFETARRILTERQDDWERLAKGLLEYETLTGDEIRKVIAGETLGGDDNADKPSSGGGTASVAAIPKTKTRGRKTGPEPEPAPL